MKKYIITIGIVGLLLAGTVFAYDSFIKLKDEDTKIVFGGELDKNGILVVKFIDGRNTCYIIPTKVNNNTVNTSISCLIR